MQINIICGPVGSGKTTYVKQKVLFGDLIIDLDEITRALSFQPIYSKPINLLTLVIDIRDFIYENLTKYKDIQRVWVISCLPNANKRRLLGQKLNAKIVVLEISPPECLRRITKNEMRKDKLDSLEPIIRKWWQDYTRNEGDIIINE